MFGVLCPFFNMFGVCFLHLVVCVCVFFSGGSYNFGVLNFFLVCLWCLCGCFWWCLLMMFLWCLCGVFLNGFNVFWIFLLVFLTVFNLFSMIFSLSYIICFFVVFYGVYWKKNTFQRLYMVFQSVFDGFDGIPTDGFWMAFTRILKQQTVNRNSLGFLVWPPSAFEKATRKELTHEFQATSKTPPQFNKKNALPKLSNEPTKTPNNLITMSTRGFKGVLFGGF